MLCIVFHLDYLCTKNKVNTMDIQEIYKIYQSHPVVTTDSRNCPEGSIFVALKEYHSMVISSLNQPWRRAAAMHH